jgi:hypothetical protein
VPHRGGAFAFSFMDRKKGRKGLEVGGGLADVVGKMRCRERIPKLGVGRPHYRMDIPGPTTPVGTRTDYSVGP